MPTPPRPSSPGLPPAPAAAVHEVVVPIFDGVIAADATTAVEVFERTSLRGGGCPYRVRVAASKATVDAGAFDIRTRWRLDALATADTVIVPGRADPTVPTSPALLRAIRAASERGARVASICVGAFILAEAGLLDGLRATTHWAAADLLAQRFPAVEVDPDVLYVDNGPVPVLTSAGAAAGFDLLLHLVRADHGSDVAAATSRAVIMPIHRAGGQAQYIAPTPPAPDDETDIAFLLAWLHANLHRHLTLDDIARRAALSTRTLHRRFADQVGLPPTAYLRRLRIRRAQELLETTDHHIDTVAREVGMASATTFRAAFVDLVGTSPSDYRRAFNTPPAP